MTCESCGGEEATLTEVQRMYVTPAAWDTEESVKPAQGTEQWCEPCMLHYPHQVVEHS